MRRDEEDQPESPMTDREIRMAVLRRIGSQNYRPVKPKTIAQQIGLEPEFAHLVRRVVRKMASVGELTYGKNHLVLPRSTESNESASPNQKEPERRKKQRTEVKERLDPKKTDYNKSDAKKSNAKKTDVKKQRKGSASETAYQGTFRRLGSDGGIVRLFPTGDARLPEEVYLPRRFAQDAAQGDTVLVAIDAEASPRPARRYGGQERRPSATGHLISIVRRDTNRFVGTYLNDGGYASVEVDGGLFKRPVKVGDPTAKGAVTGDKVVLEMTHFPCHFSRGEGVIVEVLGKRGTPGLDTRLIMREYGLPEVFPERVLREARLAAHAFEQTAALDTAPVGERLGDRRDLRGETILTIDPEDARDFDDAVSLERLPNRHWRLGVHIADVAHFVPPGSELDIEARRRSTSVYLPDRVIPMLPEVISNALASLQPDQMRPAKSVFLDYTAAGILTHVEICRSYIKSACRLSYEEADDALSNPAVGKKRFPPKIAALIKRMGQFAPILKKRRAKKGAIELSFAELKITLDAEGRVTGAVEERQTPARSMIEEFMLAANGAVAAFLTSRALPFLRRIHPVPSLKKLERFAAFISSLDGLTPSPACFTGDRFAIQELLESVHGTEQEDAVQYACLCAMAKAVYSPEAEGHYALAIDNYCHFTSPIRRYPDLTVHHLLDRVLDGKKPTLLKNDLILLGQHASERERHAEEAERELKKLKLIEWMRHQVGRTMPGVVTGIERFGIFVRGTEIPAEGLVRIDTLTDDYYHYDPEYRILTGFKKGNIIRMGDRVTVEIRRADTDARQLDFWLVKNRKTTDGMPHEED